MQLTMFEEKKEITATEHWIIRVAAKLYNEHITLDNYTQSKAIKKLNNCVAPTFLIGILQNNEHEVLNQLKQFKNPHY